MFRGGATRLTRRGWISLAGAAASFSQSNSAGTARIAAVDQNAIRRRSTGLRALDRDRASPGLTMFAPITGNGEVYLTDLTSPQLARKEEEPSNLPAILAGSQTPASRQRVEDFFLRSRRFSNPGWRAASRCTPSALTAKT